MTQYTKTHSLPGILKPFRNILPFLCLALAGCGATTSSSSAPKTGLTSPAAATLGTYPLSGNTTPVRDPSLMHEGSTYYLFSTDIGPAAAQGSLPIRCSTDQASWTACGYVFATLPAWVHTAVPGATGLWAPDISYFGGAYHLYYAASTLLSQVSAIGEATNATLDPSSPAYRWVDHGQVIASTTGDDFNALDPSILADSDGSVWLTYGSFWTGIKQRRIDASTGMLSAADATIYSLAGRPAAEDHAVEGGSLVHAGSYYYLFLSFGHCCKANYLEDDYEEVVGRSSSPHGPFLDMNEVDLASGGGTVLLAQDGGWMAPGGGSISLDAAGTGGEMVFHAAKISENGAPYLWLKQLSWASGWPVLQ